MPPPYYGIFMRPEVYLNPNLGMFYGYRGDDPRDFQAFVQTFDGDATDTPPRELGPPQSMSCIQVMIATAQAYDELLPNTSLYSIKPVE